MKTKCLLSLGFFIFHSSLILSVRAQGAAFTYQGRLVENGAAGNGTCDLRFNLFGANSGGPALTGAIDANDVIVSNGLFTVTLAFDPRAFTGEDRWLEIAVRPGASTGTYTNLVPRQPLTSTPYALRAANFSGPVADTQLSANVARLNGPATFTGPVSFSSASGNFNGSFSGNGGGVTNVAFDTLNPSGVFSWSGHFALAASPAMAGGSSFVTTADVNGDGKVDLIIANFSDLSILTNNGSGNFVVSSATTVPFTFSITAADVNGDGRSDLISANWNTNTLTVLTNNGSGAFALASLPFAGANPFGVAAADINGDGKVDLISARHDELLVLTNSGSGGFLLASSVSTVGFFPGSPNSVAAADFNGDGQPDLVSVSLANSPLLVFTNNGSGSFATGPLPMGADASGTSVTAADVNGDGRMDAVTANTSARTISVLTNDGSGRLVSASLLNAGSPNFVVATDVNGDGKVDLISANAGGPTMLSVLTNDGKGGFALVSSPGGGSGAFSVAALDVNADGRMDLIAGKNSGGLAVWVNVPNFSASFSGTFTGNNLFDGTNTFSGNNTILPPATLSFGAGTRQMLNLFGNLYGIGIQQARMYFRTGPGLTDGFDWFRDGAHSDTTDDPGPGGQKLMSLTSSGLLVSGTVNGVEATTGNGGGSAVYGNNTGAGNGVAGRATGTGIAIHGDNASANGLAGYFNGNVAVATPGTLSFGAQTRQMLNLWGTQYGIGVQDSTLYFRCEGNPGPFVGFRWYKGGVHHNDNGNAGGGTELMSLGSTYLYVNGAFVSSSDRNMKENFAAVEPREVLEKVAAMPITRWNYKNDETAASHLGPVAQDFHAAFGLGTDDKHIATVDADGVALAAIQGLNQKVEGKSQQAEDRIHKLESENKELRNALADLKSVVEKLTQTQRTP